MTESDPQEIDPALAYVMRQLDAIQIDAELAPDAKPAPKPVTGSTFLAPDPNDPDVIIHPVKLTRYDKAIQKLRDLEAKRAALPADHDARKVALLDYQISKAKEAVTAAQGDVARRRDGIDAWRDDNPEERKRSRRKVRSEPNADLSHLNADQKAQRKRDQRSDANWLKRRREAKVPEVQIQAELAVRIREREAKRAAQVEVEKQQEEMENRPDFGMFG